MKLKHIVKVLTMLGALAVIFVTAVIGEEHIRMRSKVAIPITTEGSGISKVQAFQRPDLLWVGKAWWITVESLNATEVVLDGSWKAHLPPGTNTIFWNHDSTSTTKYGPSCRVRVPTSVVVKTTGQAK